MTAEPLDLTSGSLVGRVREIEASRVTVEVHDPAVLARVTVFDLVSLPGRQHGERLIGLVESVGERPSAELHAGTAAPDGTRPVRSSAQC